jgi:hypothetical protein
LTVGQKVTTQELEGKRAIAQELTDKTERANGFDPERFFAADREGV